MAVAPGRWRDDRCTRRHARRSLPSPTTHTRSQSSIFNTDESQRRLAADSGCRTCDAKALRRLVSCARPGDWTPRRERSNECDFDSLAEATGPRAVRGLVSSPAAGQRACEGRKRQFDCQQYRRSGSGQRVNGVLWSGRRIRDFWIVYGQSLRVHSNSVGYSWVDSNQWADREESIVWRTLISTTLLSAGRRSCLTPL